MTGSAIAPLTPVIVLFFLGDSVPLWFKIASEYGLRFDIFPIRDPAHFVLWTGAAQPSADAVQRMRSQSRENYREHQKESREGCLATRARTRLGLCCSNSGRPARFVELEARRRRGAGKQGGGEINSRGRGIDLSRRRECRG